LDLAKERPDSKHLVAELDALEAEEKSLEARLRDVDAQIQRCEPVDYSSLEQYCAAVLEEELDDEQRKDMFSTFVKSFVADKVKKEITIVFYGVPLLPIVRNEFLEAKEREVAFGDSIKVEIPEYEVKIAYRKRRFIVPQEYRFISERVSDVSATKESIVSSEPRDLLNKEQLLLF
jgi:hypothetical protein